MGKAIARVERVFPASDTTKKVVTSKLYEKYCPLPQPNITSPSTSKDKYASVVKFYQGDDISQQAPGRKVETVVCNLEDRVLWMEVSMIKFTFLQL